MLSNTKRIDIYRYIYTLLLLIISATTTYAQLINVKEYNTETLLNQRYVYGISQLPNRTLVLSTNEGLVTFDGNTFNNYALKNKLASDFVTCHIADKQGNIWAGHYQNGISYVGANNKIRLLLTNELKSTKITGLHIYYTSAFTYNVYVCTLGKGIYVLNNLGEIITIINNASEIYQSALHNAQLFIATEYGFKITNLVTNKTEFEQDSISGDNITAVCNHNNKWIIALTNNKVYVLNNNKYELLYTHTNKDAKLLQLLPHNNELLINTFNNGVVGINFTSKNIINYYNTYYGLATTLVQSMFIDDENNIWIGTYGNGLIQLNRQQFLNFTNDKYTPINNVTAITKNIAKHTLFIGANKTLLEYNDDFTQLKYSKAINDKITCLSYSNDTVWIGTESKGVLIFNIKTNSLTSFNALHKLPLEQVNDIKQYRNQTYIATNNGLHIYNNVSQNLKTFTTNEGLLHNNIYNICIDKIGRIWFAAHGSGIFYLKDKEFVVFKDVKGLNYFNINSITSDVFNTVWIATEGDGVFKFENNNFTNYRTSNGLLSNFCYGVTCDNKGGVWVTNRSGLSYKKNNQKTFAYLQKNEGINIENFNLNAHYNFDNDDLYWGGENGLVHYAVKNAKLLFKTPSIKINSITIDGVPAIIDINNKINLPYGKYDVAINYNATTFLQHEKVRYKYILDGHETNWNDNVSGNTSYYPQLADGTYTYKLYASNADGFRTAQPLTLTIIVDKPIYKKWWPYLVFAILMYICIQFLIHYRLKKLRSESFKLQKLVDVRTNELREEKNNLETTKKELEVINRDMTDSINYARRIQDAMLPNPEKVKLYFKNYFVFYVPRDIVSGDFYFHTYKLNKNIFILGDCTGHGVPGGFMSMISNTLISKIINDLTDDTLLPSTIIKQLQANIVKELNQRDTQNQSRDGLDIAICIVNETDKTIQLSSAGRPIYHVRNNELTEYKGSVFGVGGYDENIVKEYFTHTIAYHTNDFIYMSSDGYPDQFGGGINRKFMSKKLKEMFKEISSQNIATQQEIVSKTFINWKGNAKQVDDILVIGIGV
jgi:ligand-binding sensor domain-containing protein/serine phosphatase RsbU (regulator of sigma subunit)